MKNNEKRKNERNLAKLARHLMLTSSFIDNLGVLNGKMGIIIFFYHYAQYTQCERYEKFAGELVDELYEDISARTPIDFANGLCGIAWGMTYLINHHFVSADTDILCDFDSKIMQIDVTKMNDLSIETGLAGIGYYVLCRYCEDNGRNYLLESYVAAVRHALLNSRNMECLKVLKLFHSVSHTSAVQMDDILRSFLPKDGLKPTSIGIKNGLTGLALKMMMTYE